MDDINFIGKDPGATRYGNFINYYTFHSAEERMKNLHKTMFPTLKSYQPILCLDVGCNTGVLTYQLFLYTQQLYPEYEIHFLATDIDTNLIERAQELHKGINNITFMTLNIMKQEERNEITNYLNKFSQKSFNITFCFSVTMWIHINNGDIAFIEFLKYIKLISDTIIIEPQPWNCYRNAQRRLKKNNSTFPFYETLKIRGNVQNIIESILAEHTHRKIYESSCTSWKRVIQSYQLQK